ncbi:hypothetical protein LguiB_026815 [Lonicera macranthoides]
MMRGPKFLSPKPNLSRYGGVKKMMNNELNCSSPVWRLVEKEGPLKYNWEGYAELVKMVEKHGLKIQVVMSFHQCGGNVGDSCRPGASSGLGKEDSNVLNPRKNLEEEYLEYEANIITTFSVVDNMKEHFHAEQGKTSRKDNSKVKELFEKIGKLREEFESFERPNLEVETPPSQEPESPAKQDAENTKKPQESQSHAAEAPETKKKEQPKSPQGKGEQVLDAEAELAKLESEFGNRDYSNDKIGDWEFDKLERELRAGDLSTSK